MTTKMLTYDTTSYVPHEHQWLFHRSKARFRVLACGRRWGKDRACTYELLRMLPDLLKRNQGKGLVPNVLCWVVAPTYPISELLWAELKTFMPKGFVVKTEETDRCLRCVGGVEIWMKTASEPENLVGAGLDVLLVTEAGLVQEEAWMTGLRPMLSSPGRAGLAMFNGTPKGLNWFHKMFLRGRDRLDTEVESWNYPTWDNPYIDRAEVDKARHELPQDVFNQEYAAEFLSDSGLVFHHVDGCVQGQLEEPKEGHRYVGGVDLAKHHDFTVVGIADRATRRVVYWDRFSQLDYTVQKGRIAEAFGKYNKARGWLDSTGVGDPILEDLQRMGVGIEGYTLTARSKRQLVDGLAIALEQEQLRFPRIPELIGELKAYQYETTQAGNIRTNAPSGQYDDCVVALGLVNYGLGVASPTGAVKVATFVRRGW